MPPKRSSKKVCHMQGMKKQMNRMKREMVEKKQVHRSTQQDNSNHLYSVTLPTRIDDLMSKIELKAYEAEDQQLHFPQILSAEKAAGIYTDQEKKRY